MKLYILLDFFKSLNKKMISEHKKSKILNERKKYL